MALSDFIQNARDPLFTAGQFQRSPRMDWTQTPVIGGPSGFLEQNPEAVWTRYLSGRLGVGPTDQTPFGQFMQNQFRSAQNAFKAAAAEDPTLTFQRYVNAIAGQDFLNRFNAMLPSQRGENWSRAAGAARWLSDL